MKPEVKPKKCKNFAQCGNMFTPFRTTDRYCSPACARSMQQPSNKAIKSRLFHQAKTQQQPMKRVKAKARTKKRDQYQCLLAGVIPHTCDKLRESHHILYLSEGGVDEDWNFITLCGYAHHKIAHADKSLQWRLLVIVNGWDWIDRLS